MKIMISLTTCALLVLAVTLFADSPEMTEAEKQQKMMQLMRLAQPGPEHERLASLAGEWQLSNKAWMQPGEPLTSEGTGTAEMILGGRFLKITNESTVMGQQYTGLSIIGFDRRHEEYTIVAYDNTGTYYVAARGKMEDDGKTIRMYGEDVDPIFGFTQKYDMVLTLVDNNTFVFEIIFKNPEMTFGQEEFKMVEVTNTRVVE
ncbi:DUF1579 domain-containing protein [candidate division GN15 bacterium]|nr:DUF1579 domain-containing protein [candidate division GN15 bacterium]